MSSQLTTLVPVFDGSNYGIWSKAIKAFLMSQGLWGHVDGTITEPPVANIDDHALWSHQNDMATGTITLRLTHPIQQFVESWTTANDIWDNLHDCYGAASVLTIYKDFKEAFFFFLL